MQELFALEDAHEDELLARARSSDQLAVAELYRRHRPAAEAYAAGITDPQRAADITADAMIKVFGLFERGLGPERAFRAYLFSTVRTLAIDTARKASRETPVDDVHEYGQFTTEDVIATQVEHADVVDAFKSLPPRSQQALWEHLVEGRPLDEIGEHLALTANAVAALSFRAREALRQAYLAQHMACTKNPDCDAYADHLPKHVRGKLKGRVQRDVEAHLDVCHDCATATVALMSINQRLGALLPPAVLAGGLSVGLDPESAEAAARKLAGAEARAGSTATRAAGRSAARAARVVAAALAAGGVAVLATSGPERSPSQSLDQSAPSEWPHSSARMHLSNDQEPAVLDSSVSDGISSTLGHVGSNWHHITFPVDADSQSTIAVRVDGADDVLMHSDPEHGAWNCTAAPDDSRIVRSLNCVVPTDQLPSAAIALDVEPGAGAASVSIDVTSPHDTDPTNNHVTVELGGRIVAERSRAVAPELDR